MASRKAVTSRRVMRSPCPGTGYEGDQGAERSHERAFSSLVGRLTQWTSRISADQQHIFGRYRFFWRADPGIANIGEYGCDVSRVEIAMTRHRGTRAPEEGRPDKRYSVFKDRCCGERRKSPWDPGA